MMRGVGFTAIAQSSRFTAATKWGKAPVSSESGASHVLGAKGVLP
jgi:hypothetical protein